MEIINNLSWSIATVLLLISGIYFGIKLDFLHLNFKRIFKSLKNDKNNSDGISPFESLTIALGGCIGVGSLAGIALSIYKGGIGTIFWILLSCLIIAPNSIAENMLAVIYQDKNKKEFLGGPSYYIKKGLGYKKIAILYALLVVIAYIFGFLTIQANTIVKSFTNLYNVNSLIIGLIIGLISFLIINSGTKGIAKFSSIFVPIMGLVYLLVSIFIVFKNINLIPSLLINIIKEAFNIKTFGYSFFGIALIGIQRGIFSSEVGVGTSAIASGSSDVKNPLKQGLIQTLGVYFVIFIVCLSTALIILTSNYTSFNYQNINGIEITQNAFIYHLGNLGNIILYFSLISFSFSTIISGYFYGESNMKFIFKKISKKHLFYFKLLTCILLVLASIISSNILWNFVDILTSFLVIINVISILSLRKDVIREYNEFKRE